MLKMKTPCGDKVVSIEGSLALIKTYKADAWRGEHPAEFPPYHWVISNHVFDAIVESLDAVAPRNGNALEEDEEEKTETGHRVRIQNLEHEHSALGDASQADEVANYANNGDENFLAATEKLWPLVNHCSDEALHCAELRVETNQQQHEEEQTSPKWRSRQLEHGWWVRQEGESGTCWRRFRSVCIEGERSFYLKQRLLTQVAVVRGPWTQLQKKWRSRQT